ncbi:hypothetical protein MBANPS3_005302, partial [Mucor bainieri]
KSLDPVFGPLIYFDKLLDKINEDYLSDIRIANVTIRKEIDEEQYFSIVHANWVQMAQSKGKRATLIFCKRIAQAKPFCAHFIAQGTQAQRTTTDTP